MTETVAVPYVTFTASIGIDVGQKVDPSAVAVAEVMDAGLSTAHFNVRALEKLELGTPWREVAGRVGTIVEGVHSRLSEAYHAEREKRQLHAIRIDEAVSWPPSPRIHLRVDATGIGSPVTEMIREAVPYHIAAAVRVSPCFFTHGDRISRSKGGISVGKAYLVSRLKALVQTGRVRIALHTPFAEEMVKELLDYEIRVDENANDKYGAFKVGSHDDLVTSLGLSVLPLRRPPRGLGFFMPGT